MAAFRQDVDYYGLPVDMVESWMGHMMSMSSERFSSVDHSAGMSVTDHNLVAAHDAKEEQDEWAMGERSYSGQDHALITILIEHVGDTLIMFGVISLPPQDRIFRDSAVYAVSDYCNLHGGSSTRRGWLSTY